MGETHGVEDENERKYVFYASVEMRHGEAIAGMYVAGFLAGQAATYYRWAQVGARGG